MRIIAGKFRGKTLTAPAGTATRPTSDRARQTLFDMIMHAPWGGRGLIEGATVLDAFAGTGALGLEALSRGAGFAHFIERDADALTALRANIAGCKISQTQVHAASVLTPPKGPPCALVFLDPPYNQGLIELALPKLRLNGWIIPGTIVIAETSPGEPLPATDLLADRSFGAARIRVWRDENMNGKIL